MEELTAKQLDDELLRKEIEEMFDCIEIDNKDFVSNDFALSHGARSVERTRHRFYKIKKHFEPWEVALRCLMIFGLLNKAHEVLMIPVNGKLRPVTVDTMFRRSRKVIQKFNDCFERGEL